MFNLFKKAKKSDSLDMPPPPPDDAGGNMPPMDNLDIPSIPEFGKDIDVSLPPLDSNQRMPDFPEMGGMPEENSNFNEYEEQQKNIYQPEPLQYVPQQNFPQQEKYSQEPAPKQPEMIRPAPVAFSLPVQLKKEESSALDYSTPLFISLEQYREGLSKLESFKEPIKAGQDLINTVDACSTELNNEYDKYYKSIEFSLKRLILIDKRLVQTR